jgi:hypothetical protein
MFDLTTWTNENSLALITILVAAFGGAFAYLQWRKSVKLRHAEFLNQIIEKLRFNDELSKAIYLVDYNQNWYGEGFHGGSDNECLVDKLLSYIDYICYLIESHNITKSEKLVLVYEIHRVCENWSCQAYLWNLHWWSKSRNSTCSFQHLIDYGLSNGIIKKENFRIDSEQYPKYLNFQVTNSNAFYNTKRPHGTLAYKTPERFEELYRKNRKEIGQGVQKSHFPDFGL